MSEATISVNSAESGNKGLKGGALGLVSSVVIGMSSTAPAYSLAASLGLVVATTAGSGIVGVKAPAIMLLAFVPMYFIAVAYAELNKAEPDCGTTFTWAARAFGARVGWVLPLLGGIMLLGAFIIAAKLYSQSDYGETTLFGIGGVFLLGVGSLVLGVVLMEIYARIRPDYFAGRTLTRGQAELVLAPGAGVVPHVGLPDSGKMPTVISPDLSNLPPGERAVDAREIVGLPVREEDDRDDPTPS